MQFQCLKRCFINLVLHTYISEGECLERVVAKVTEGLEGLEKQPANVEKYSGLEKGPATFGVVKKMRDNDMELHENNTVRLLKQRHIAWTKAEMITHTSQLVQVVSLRRPQLLIVN